uniref:Putative portal protein n=1 Tax=viral metagenome TaxID=1070528 RepID=A0A6M3L9G5_9ZZZZ
MANRSKSSRGEKAVLAEDQEKWFMLSHNYDAGMISRRAVERRWVICLAFLAGRQYVFFDENVHMLQQLGRSPGKIRTVDNQLVGRWAREVADMIKTNPIMSVIPSTNDDDDIKAAKMGDKVLKSWWQTQKMRKKVRILSGWIYGCGNGFLYDRWNPMIGPTELNEQGQLVYLGDAEVGVRSPFDVVVPAAQFSSVEIHDLPWIIELSYVPIETIQNTWAKGGHVMPESFPTGMADLSGIIGAMAGTAPVDFEGAFVKRMSMKPNVKYPKGLYLVGANGVVLEEDEYPYLDYHIEHFKDIDIPGMFWGTCKVEQGIGLQKTWNRNVSSVNEFNKVCAKGKLLVPKGAQLAADPDDTHGQKLTYVPVLGHKPEWMTPPQLATSATLGLQITKTSLEDLFSQHEVSRGTNKSDIRSGLMVGLLREQDAQGAIPSHAVYEEGMESCMSRVLKRIQAGYSAQRMLKIRGEDGTFEIFAFKGADLRDATDVMVKRDSSLPDSKTARQAQIFERYQGGLYGDPADPKVRLKVAMMLEDAVVEDIYDEMKIDQTYAKWENDALLRSNGVQQLVNAYDNHAIHIEIHTNFMKSVGYQKLKMENPSAFAERDMMFQEHLGFHQDALEAQRQKMLSEQIALKGGQNG